MRRTLLTAMLYAAHALAPAPQVSVIDAAAKVVQAGVAAAPTGKPVKRRASKSYQSFRRSR